MAVKRCLDTYALMEIAQGNPRFKDLVDAQFVVTDLTLAEFYAVLLREHGRTLADSWHARLERYAQPCSRALLIEAVRFRHQHRTTRISFFDAIGYVYSVENGCYFVTGDRDFETLPHVEFRKK